jgi:hypothetical protein
MNDKILDLLYRSFDSGLSSREQQQLDKALAGSAELRAERDRITAMREAVRSSAAGSFKPFLAERVMQRIGGELGYENGLQELFDSLVFAFRRVALIGAVAAVVLVGYNLKASDEVTLAAAFGVAETTGEELEELLETPLESVLE